MKPNPQWRGDPTFLPELLRHFGIPFEGLPGWDRWGMGDYDRIQGVFWHHTGSETTSAQYIKNNGNMNGAASSLAWLGRNAKLILTAIGISWHAGRGFGHGWPTNNANPVSLGLEMQGDGTRPWPEDQLDMARRFTAVILWFLGKRATIETMIGHWEYSYQAQGKWDPGAGNGKPGALMDMDHQRHLVNQLIDNINRHGRLDPPAGDSSEGNLVQQIIEQVRYIFGQLSPWAQLGHDAQGRPLTLVDGVAALRCDVAALRQELHDLVSHLNSSKGR